jgi:tRNA C32,U32 (ribose-2'-O)-methylase TrmJ
MKFYIFLCVALANALFLGHALEANELRNEELTLVLIYKAILQDPEFRSLNTTQMYGTLFAVYKILNNFFRMRERNKPKRESFSKKLLVY